MIYISTGTYISWLDRLEKIEQALLNHLENDPQRKELLKILDEMKALFKI